MLIYKETVRPDNDICTRNKRGNIKSRQISVSKLNESTKENVWQTKIDRIRSYQIRKSCCIQLINERKRREWEENVMIYAQETREKA